MIGAGAAGLLFLAVPLAVLVGRGIASRGWEGMPEKGITEAFFLSLVTTCLTAGLIVFLGTPLAYMFARYRFPFKRPLNLLIELPIVLPPAVAGLALLAAFGRRGLLGPSLSELGISLPFSTAAVVMAQAFVAAPFYIRAAQLGFQGVSPDVEDAARVDGAGGWPLFWHITLPLTRRALAVGLILCWARALGEFGATILFAGNYSGRTQTMPLLIYSVLEGGDLDAAIWTGLLLIGMALVALMISQWLGRQSEETE